MTTLTQAHEYIRKHHSELSADAKKQDIIYALTLIIMKWQNQLHGIGMPRIVNCDYVDGFNETKTEDLNEIKELMRQIRSIE